MFRIRCNTIANAKVWPLGFLLAGNIASAATFSTATSPSWPAAPAGTWNPKAEDGLLAIKSEAIQYLDDQSFNIQYADGPKLYTEHHQGSAAAAVFGSDTSGGNGLLDPRMLGYAVEPMAFAAATNSRVCTLGGQAYSCYLHNETYASASASVKHRIVQRGVPDIAPEVQGILDTLGKVYVRLDYALHASASNPDYPWPSTAKAGFSVTGVGTIYTRMACSASHVSSSCTSIGEESDTWRAQLDRSTVDRVVNYTINAGASVWVDARYRDVAGNHESAQAVADPYLYLDPTWEYASYFMVQQESLLHPGEWVEVTRLWQQQVPEPVTGALMLAGLGLVLGVAANRRQA